MEVEPIMCSGLSGGSPERKRPVVTVLVPIYNVEQYLSECLDSLCAQTYKDFEVICINDGSTDQSRDIIQRYLDLDDRFHVIDKPNSGYGASMNQGLNAARGEYIAILESDDFFEPTALQLLLDVAQEHDSDVVKGDFWLYWSQPHQHRELFGVIDSKQAGKTMRPIDDLAIFFRKPSIWSAIYKRSFLERNKIRFLETPGASYQDAGFNFKVWASADRASFVSDPVLFYRQDNEGSSVKSSAKAYCVCDEYKSMGLFVKERGGSDKRQLLAILERMKFDSYRWNLDRLSGELKREFCEYVSAEFARDISEGLVDESLFEPDALADMKLLASNADEFLASHERTVGQGLRGSIAHYWSLGGSRLVLRTLLGRMKHSSLRRTNARGGSA